MTLNQYEVGTTITLTTTLLDDAGIPYTPTSISGLILSPDGVSAYYPVNSIAVGEYYFKYKIGIEGEHTYSFISETPLTDLTTVDSGFFIAVQYESNDLDYLIPQLRDHLGDRDKREYSTDFLRQSLFSAFKALLPRWRYKYILDSLNKISRDQNRGSEFVFAEPPVIQRFDERPIILQASIGIKSGVVFSSAGTLQSWRDDEISFSNISSNKALYDSLMRDQNELDDLLPSRSKKLAPASKQSLPGFKYPTNVYEGEY